MLEDTLKGLGRPMIPPVLELLQTLSPTTEAREWMPAVAPSVPYKLLDIGMKMGSYKLGEHVPMRQDTDNIFHPRYIRDGVPPVNTFHAAVHDRAAKWVNDVDD